ncbi:MAG: segregation/condensation protein A [Spirochaetota bacterium]|jgi:segregation and condensation protein A|nr:segregation/condensation protein A [Spirochaetota bacterium]
METQERAGYQIRTPLFEGPLDLLLQLVRRYEINIYDIPITLITEQFMQYIALMERLDLEIASEFIVMAAHLCVIKSRMLLPHEAGDDDDEDPRSELVAQLLEYQKFKAAAQILEESEGISLAILERRAGQIVFDFPGDENNWVDVKLFDLVGAFSRIMARAAPATPAYPEFRDFEDDYDPEEKVAQIATLLDIRNQVDFEDIITPGMQRGEIIIIFFAILDMIKRGLILVRQHRLFGDITILKRGAL